MILSHQKQSIDQAAREDERRKINEEIKRTRRARNILDYVESLQVQRSSLGAYLGQYNDNRMAVLELVAGIDGNCETLITICNDKELEYVLQISTQVKAHNSLPGDVALERLFGTMVTVLTYLGESAKDD